MLTPTASIADRPLEPEAHSRYHITTRPAPPPPGGYPVQFHTADGDAYVKYGKPVFHGSNQRGDACWTAEIITQTWYQAETGRIPISGAGYGGKFAGEGFDGIWLDRLMLGANVDAVSVSGSTLSPDSVPRYLRSLAQDPALKGGKIDEFLIEKPRRKVQDGKTVITDGRLSFTAGHRGLRAPTPAATDGEST